MKIFDCVTFYNENLVSNIRFNILNDLVDYFVICESKYDHQGQKKNINFDLNLHKEFKNKIIHVIVEEKFPENFNSWQRQAYQRECIFRGLEKASSDDYIMFSDPDEIPNPEKLKNFNLEKKFGIFLQKIYTFKINLFNSYETPWEGTRITKKKNLKSINWMRQKVRTKNMRYPFWRIDKEKNIQTIQDGGWHFSYLMNEFDISKKLKTFAHEEFSNAKFSSTEIIKRNIEQKKDLFGRNHIYTKIEIDESFPEYIRKNILKFKEYII